MHGSEGGNSIYSLPITFGSSGGMIVDGNGRLVGVTNNIRRFPISFMMDPYDQITGSPTYKAIKQFLEF